MLIINATCGPGGETVFAVTVGPSLAGPHRLALKAKLQRMALPLNWPRSKPFQPPSKVEEVDPNEWECLVLNSSTSSSSSTLLHGLNSDIEFDAFMTKNKGQKMSLVQFGSLHCLKCAEFFPDFLRLARTYNRSMAYGMAGSVRRPFDFQPRWGHTDVEWLKDRAAGVKYSPTFTFYSKGGRKVDEVLGKDKQKLEDHIWLWQDDS